MKNRILPRGTQPDQIASAVSVLVRDLDFSKSWKVTVEEFKPKRTTSQNAYLFGVAYPAFLEGGGEALRGWSVNELHEFMLMQHFGEESLELGGRSYSRPVKRSSKLSRQEFSDYLEFLSAYAGNLGIRIPEPSYDTDRTDP